MVIKHLKTDDFNLLFWTFPEVEKLKGMLLQQDGGNHRPVDIQSDDLKAAKQEAARAQESLKVKHALRGVRIRSDWSRVCDGQVLGDSEKKNLLCPAEFGETPGRAQEVAGGETAADRPGQRGRGQEEPGHEEVHGGPRALHSTAESAGKPEISLTLYTQCRTSVSHS